MRAVTFMLAVVLAGAGTSSWNTGAADSRPPAPGLQSSASAERWPQFRGGPDLSGGSASAVPSTPTLLWTYDTGEPIDSSAAIVDGTVYVGSLSGDLLALNLDTGDLRWRYHASDDGIRRVVASGRRRCRVRR